MQSQPERIDSFGAAGLQQAINNPRIKVIDGTQPLPQADDGRILSKLVEEDSFRNAEGYVFMGKPDLLSTFLLYYAVDAAQSGIPAAFLQDAENNGAQPGAKARLKPIVIVNHGPNGEKPYDDFLERAKQLHNNKLLKLDFSDILHVVDSPEWVAQALRQPKSHAVFNAPALKDDQKEFIEHPRPRDESNPSIFVCCSFSTQDEFYVELAKAIGEQITKEGYNLVTGGGRYPKGDPSHGMMFNVQKSAYDATDKKDGAKGDVTGVTFLELNPLAEHDGKGTPHFGLSRIIGTENLARRVEVMADISDALVIAPGGFGTDTESISPLLMRQVTSALMEDKPVILVNAAPPKDQLTADASRTHDKLIVLLEALGLEKGKDFHVVESEHKTESPKLLAEETARAVIDKLAALKVSPHARKLKQSRLALGIDPPAIS